MNPAFDDLLGRLTDEAEEGLLHTAAQLVVLHDGDVVCDAAVGRTHLGAPFTTDTLSALYCTAKPLVTAAVLRLVADGELSLEDRVGDVVDGVDAEAAWIGDRRVAEVLGHTAGLHALPSIIARVLPERSRWGWICATAPAGWRFGVDRAYSEFGGWYVLGRVIEALTEEPYDHYVDRIVRKGYGIDPDDLVVRFGPEGFAARRDRISVTLDLTDHLQPIPLLAEAGPETAVEWNPAFGSYGTMRGLAALYRGLLEDLAGGGRVLPADLLAEATRGRLPATYDETLHRDACFGLGVMAPLSTHEFGDAPGEDAFGHAGQGGTSFGFADPTHGVVVAALFNAGLDAETGVSFRRRTLTDSVYRALGLR
jgi:CubicO group peptidase (beta-lactamase class C family)